MDLTALATGSLLGLIASALYFAGLGLSVRAAMGSSRGVIILAVSSVLRILLLLLAGWLTAQIGRAALFGFAGAFLTVRFISVAWARAPIKDAATKAGDA